jgi:hypothetical protein
MRVNRKPKMKMTIMMMIFLLQYNGCIVPHMHWGLDWSPPPSCCQTMCDSTSWVQVRFLKIRK